MLLRVGGVVPPPTEPVELRERHSTGIGHAHRLVSTPCDRHNPHLPMHVAPPRPGFPLLVRPVEGLELGAITPAAWAKSARDVFDAELRSCGAVLLRGLPIHTAEEFSSFVNALDLPQVDTHGVSQRPEYADHVFGASEDVPATHTLHMHNEQAYLLQDAHPSYPRKIFFACLQPSETGGQTPLVLNHEFHAALGETVVQRFRSKGGVRYNRYLPDLKELDRQQASGEYEFLGPEAVRTSQETAIEALRSQPPSALRDTALREAEKAAWIERRGNSWQVRLNATTQEEAEASCVAQEMQWEWQPDGGLMMFTHSPGFIDAQAGEPVPSVWFSQASNFEAFTPTFGDGDAISTAEVEAMHAAMWRCAVAFDWEAGDILAIENERCMHGRTSFTGNRHLLCGFAAL